PARRSDSTAPFFDPSWRSPARVRCNNAAMIDPAGDQVLGAQDPAGDQVSDAQIVKRLFDAFNSRDVEAGLAPLHQEIVFEPVSGAVLNEGEPYRGHEGMRRYFAHVDEHWRELQVNPI